MTYPCWEASNGRLTIKISESEACEPTAAEIFNVVFGNAQTVRGILIRSRPDQDISEIKFSRFPANLSIRVSGRIPNSLRWEHGVQLQGHFYPANWDNDQLIIENRWYPLDNTEITDVKSWLAKVGLSDDARLTLGQLITLRLNRQPPCALVDGVEVFDSTEPPDGHADQLPSLEGLRAKLYPYQESGVRFLSFVADQGVGCILGDEMGLGKTLQVIGLMVHLQRRHLKPCLVIAPATLLENWRRELATFAPHLATTIHAGPYRTGIPSGFKAFDVVITSYDTAIRDEVLLSNISWEMIALDEAQNIKNPEALRTLAIKRLPRRVSIAVTGTPVENRLDDLWSIADFALPGLLGSLSEFKSVFGDSVEDAVALAPIVTPILLRRRVADVARDLPPRINIPQPIDLGSEFAAMYDQVRLQALEEYGPAGGLVATTRLRLFCAHPALVDENSIDKVTDVPKFARLVELLDEIFALNEKALIFTTYQEMIDIFMRHIPKQWPAQFFGFIDGRVAVTDRQPTVDRFLEHPGSGALFLNPKAAGAGLNITAANHVIHFNPEWNPALTDQATARAYRRRQTRPVTVHSLFYADTIEEVIMERASFKRNLASGAVGGHKGDVDASYIARALYISPIAGNEVSSR
ncbi:ATP-dependent helicase [Burkholderia contaminans]|nr:ATP-dependent helicase [Burkholderia contaminans]